MTRALLVTSVLLELVALSKLRVWLGVTLAWCELARAATANCGAGRGGKVSPSLDTIVSWRQLHFAALPLASCY